MKQEKQKNRPLKKNKKTFSWYYMKEKKKEKYDTVSKKVHSGEKNNVSVLAPIGGFHMPSARLFESVCLEGNVCLRRTRLNLSHILVVPSR